MSGGIKIDFNGPQTKFICDSLYKHPVVMKVMATKKLHASYQIDTFYNLTTYYQLPESAPTFVKYEPGTSFVLKLNKKKFFHSHKCVWFSIFM